MPKTLARGSQTATALAALARSEPKGIDELSSEMQKDHIVSLADRVFRAVAKTAKVTVTVDGGDEVSFESQRQQLLAEQLDSLWWKSLSSIMDFVSKGRVAYEKVWAASPTVSLRFIQSLDPLPHNKTELQLTKEGHFDGIKLKSGRKDVKDVHLEPAYSWWLALDPKPLEPHGTSRYLGAPFERWKNRREALQLRDIFMRRLMLGGGVIKVPEPEELGEIDGQPVDTFAAAASAHEARQAGGCAIVSSEFREDGSPLWDYSAYDTTVADSAPIIQLIDALDAEQLLAFGIPPKTIIEGSEVGSFALVTWQVLILYSVVDDILSQAVDSYQGYVVDKVAEANWRNSPPFAVSYTPLMDRPDDMAAEIVKAWLTSPQLSPLVLSGAVDVEAILEAVGIPVSSEIAEKLRVLQDAPLLAREVAELNAGPLSPFLNRSGR